MTCHFFFQHENQNCPPSLSQKDTLQSTVKSQVHDILEQGTKKNTEQPNADTVIMDDTTLINVRFSQKKSSKMPNGYATEVIVSHTELFA